MRKCCLREWVIKKKKNKPAAFCLPFVSNCKMNFPGLKFNLMVKNWNQYKIFIATVNYGLREYHLGLNCLVKIKCAKLPVCVAIPCLLRNREKASRWIQTGAQKLKPVFLRTILFWSTPVILKFRSFWIRIGFSNLSYTG